MSRSCPTCHRAYPDAVFFCGEDGTITIQDQPPGDVDGRLGAQLGGYVVVARVADGAMGRVFEGRHPDTKARVAVKVLHAHVARDSVAVERFKREYEAAAEMSHDHVVKVLESGTTQDGAPFMTMEYLEGEELGRALQAGKPLALERTVRIVCQVALALEYAHSFGFIHRDLKPDNLFLRRTDSGDDVRVLDFGSVKLQMETGAKLTAIGTTVGSPYYMSPEQAMGRADVDLRTDVFALGAIVYEMLTGRVAFEGNSIAKILLRIMHEQPTPPSAFGAPAALDAVIARALCKDKLERYASARELAEALLAALPLRGSIEELAHASQSDVAQRLASRVASAPAEAAVVTVRPPTSPDPKPVLERRALSEQRVRPSAISSVLPPIPTHGVGPAQLVWLALALLFACGLLVLIFD